MKIKVTITAKEAIDKGIWDSICAMKGYSVWCVNEGQMDSDHEISLTEAEAKSFGLLRRVEYE